MLANRTTRARRASACPVFCARTRRSSDLSSSSLSTISGGFGPGIRSTSAHEMAHPNRRTSSPGSPPPPCTSESLALLGYLRELPSRRSAQRLGLVLTTTTAGQSATCLAPTTINRIFATVSSFYEYMILFGHITARKSVV